MVPSHSPASNRDSNPLNIGSFTNIPSIEDNVGINVRGVLDDIVDFANISHWDIDQDREGLEQGDQENHKDLYEIYLRENAIPL